MTIYYPNCGRCKNYLGGFKCQAYPKGIPKEILQNKDKHTKVRKDQGNDIVFEEVK